jgi:3-hydroxyacyl-CoA dehydrogenase
MNFANAGIPVTLIDMNQAAVDKGIGIIRKNYAATVSPRTAEAGRAWTSACA